MNGFIRKAQCYAESHRVKPDNKHSLGDLVKVRSISTGGNL